jgi:hypothetical protein
VQQLSLAVEHLDAPVAAVRNVDVALRVGGDAVRRVELTGLVAGLAERFEPLTVYTAAVNTRILSASGVRWSFP